MQDLRIVISIFFATLSLFLFLAVALGFGGAPAENPNLWTAIGMLLFAAGLSWLAMRDNGSQTS
jgi:hypothetical protein